MPLDLRGSFPNHDAHSAQWAGLKDKKNGDLPQTAEILGYDVLLTVDHRIPHQHSLAGRNIAIIVVRSRTDQAEDLLPLVDPIPGALERIRPGETLVIGPVAPSA